MPDTPPATPIRSPLGRALAARVGLARAAVFWERCWPECAAALGVLGIFVAAALFDPPPDSPPVPFLDEVPPLEPFPEPRSVAFPPAGAIVRGAAAVESPVMALVPGPVAPSSPAISGGDCTTDEPFDPPDRPPDEPGVALPSPAASA